MIFNEGTNGKAVISANGTTKGCNVEISVREQNELWNFERQSDGSYYIKNVASDLYLDVDNEETSNGINIKVWEYSKATAQKWYIVKVKDKYRLIPKHCYDNGIRKCLDIDAGGTSTGTNVHLWEFLGEPNDYGATQVVYIEKEIYQLGDINQDGIVNVNDVNYGIRGIVGKVTLTDLEEQIGDVNEDGIFNVNDINMLMRFIVGKINEL